MKLEDEVYEYAVWSRGKKHHMRGTKNEVASLIMKCECAVCGGRMTPLMEKVENSECAVLRCTKCSSAYAFPGEAFWF